MTAQADQEAEIQRLLTELSEPGVSVQRRDQVLVLGGDVESPQRRDEICARITERFPDAEIACDIGIVRAQAPTEVEEIS